MIDPAAFVTESEELILLQSKCHVPSVAPDVLARERLYSQLDGWPSRRLTYVQGPPGFGKTMLASGWLQARREALAALGAEVSWISLDPQDNDPRLFLAYAAAALQPAAPGAAVAVEQNLRRAQFDLRRALAILLNGIASRAAPLLLVLDDYQHIANERIHEAVRWILEQGPANLHLLILSRQSPPPAFGSFAALAGVLLLDTEDLRFRQDEIGRYVEQLLGRVSDPELAKLAALSGGWITGLKLAAFQLPHTADADTYAALLHGQNQWLTRYFVSEFLLHQPRLLQEFLLQTSILEQISAPLCTAVTGQADAGHLLQQAVDAGFFLRPIDRAGARFTYHDLFRELLAAELGRRCPPQQIAQLRQRAAVWLEANGEIGAALRHYLAADLVGDAVALLERHCLQTILRGDLDRARRWLAQMRDSGAEPSARLILDRGWLYSMADRVDTLQLLQATQAAWERLIAAEEDAEEMQLERDLQLAGAHHLAGNHQEALSRSAQLAGRMSPQSHSFMLGTLHFLQMVLRMAKLEEAREHGHKALAIFEEHGWINGLISVLRGLSPIACNSGDAQDALRKCHQALRLAKIDRQEQTLEAIYIHRHLADLLYTLNRLDEAREQLREMVAKAELLGETHWLMWGRIMLALCDLAADSTASTAAAKDAIGTGLDVTNVSAILLDTLRETTIRFWIAAGKPDNAWDVARQFAVQLSNSPRDYDPRNLIAYLSGYLAHGQDLEAIEHFLIELQQAVDQQGAIEYQLQVHVLQAWYYLKCGDEAAARSQLAPALDIVALTGYVRYLLDVPDLSPLLAGLEHPAIKQFPELSLARRSPAAAPDLTDQELAILRLVAERRTNAEIAEALVITVGTVKWHLHNIYRKLDVGNRRAAAACGEALGYF